MKTFRLALLSAVAFACLVTPAAHAAPNFDLTFGKNGYAFVTAPLQTEDPSFTMGGVTKLDDGYVTVDDRCGDGVCETVVSRFDSNGVPVLGFGQARGLPLRGRGVAAHDSAAGVASLAAAFVAAVPPSTPRCVFSEVMRAALPDRPRR